MCSSFCACKSVQVDGNLLGVFRLQVLRKFVVLHGVGVNVSTASNGLKSQDFTLCFVGIKRNRNFMQVRRCFFIEISSIHVKYLRRLMITIVDSKPAYPEALTSHISKTLFAG